MHQKLFDTLSQDHGYVKEIFGKILETSAGARKTCEDLLYKLEKELVPHMAGEERTLYPALLEKSESKMKALESIEEHHVTKILFQELREIDIQDEKRTAKAQVLSEVVKHHIQEEEEKIFENARKFLSHEKAKEILGEFLKVKKEAQKTVTA